MGEEKGRVDWIRKPKEVDLRNVDTEKLNKATTERGIEVEPPAGGVGKSKVTKVVVRGMPEPEDNSSK